MLATVFNLVRKRNPDDFTALKKPRLRTYFYSVLGAAITAITLLWGMAIFITLKDEQDLLTQAKVSLENLTRAYAEQTAKTLEGGDQAVRFIRSEFRRNPETLDIRSYLKNNDIIHANYHQLAVIGRDGFLLHSSQNAKRVDLHEREHFRVHAQGTQDQLFISKPLIGKTTGKWSIQLTRRVDDERGNFSGVVVVSMPPEYFTKLYPDFHLGPQGMLALAGVDGIVRARAAADKTEPGLDVSQNPFFQNIVQRKTGIEIQTSAFDGVRRITAFRTLDNYPLIAMAGMGMDDVLAPLKWRRIVTFALTLTMTLAIIQFNLKTAVTPSPLAHLGA